MSPVPVPVIGLGLWLLVVTPLLGLGALHLLLGRVLRSRRPYENVDIQDTSGRLLHGLRQLALLLLTNQPVLYITNSVDNAVEFTSDAASSYSAAEEVDSITFTFTADSTIINDGKVQFRGIPSSWSPLPNSKGPAGKTTVTINGDRNITTTEGIRYGSTVSVDVPDLAT